MVIVRERAEHVAVAVVVAVAAAVVRVVIAAQVVIAVRIVIVVRVVRGVRAVRVGTVAVSVLAALVVVLSQQNSSQQN